jgi:phosphate-selective porin OprO and OprP
MTLEMCAVAVLVAGMGIAPARQDQGPAATGATGVAQPAPSEGGQEQKVPKEKDKAKDGKKKDKEKDKDKEDHGFVWRDRPSFRWGSSFKVDFRVKLQADFWSSPDPTEREDGGLDWSRRRVGIKGFVFKKIEYEIEHDLASDGEWRDVYVNLAWLSYAQAQGGKFKIPFSYEALTGPADLDYVYRSRAADALACGRSVGAMAHGQVRKKAVHYQIAYFEDDGDRPPELRTSYPDEPLPADLRQPAIAVRGTVAPFHLVGNKGLLKTLTVGAAMVSTDVPFEGPNHLQGESVSGYEFFPRHYYTNGRRLRTGLEFVWTPGPAGVSAEYLVSKEGRVGVGVGTPDQLDQTVPDLVGRGWYLSGTWVLTGENKEGGINPKKPIFRGGFGAVEVGARYESLTFETANPDGPPSFSRRSPTVMPNRERALTLGANWYLNKWVKVQFNGIHESFLDPDRSPIPDRPSFWSFACRLQFVL